MIKQGQKQTPLAVPTNPERLIRQHHPAKLSEAERQSLEDQGFLFDEAGALLEGPIQELFSRILRPETEPLG